MPSMNLPAKIKSIKIADYSSYVIMAFIFSIPISTTGSNILALLIALLWLIEGRFKEKFQEISKNKVTLAVLAYVLLHVVGLLWTSNYDWGLYTIKKQWKLLLLPVFLTMVKKEHAWYYINSFIASMILSVVISYGIWLEIFSFKDSTPSNPSPFIMHVMYNPLLALAIYLLSIQLQLNNLSSQKKIAIMIIIAGMTINMFLVPGRTGQTTFFFLVVVLIFQSFKKNILTKLITCLIAIPFVFFVSYSSIDQFKERVNASIENLNNFDFNAPNSIAERATFLVVSTEIIKDNPIIGVGTGDFPQAYKNKINTSDKIYGYAYTENPHNQYLLVLSQFGMVGLILFSSIFYFQFRFALSSSFPLKYVLVTFPLFYLFIFLGDSSLQVSGTSLLFSIFSAFLYKTT